MRRRDAYVDGRRVHFRYSGSGPALVLIHASPIASQVFERDYAPVFDKHFTCIAPDTPGNGLSDPLPDAENRTMEDYAEALAKFLDKIGVRRAVLYGRHTGAEIALAFSQLFPERSRFVYCDGFPVFLREEIVDSKDQYLPSFEPDWAGGFLPRLWFRYREQHVYWPWYKHSPENIADTDVPDTDFIHRGVLDLLHSGDNYIAPYDAAFRGGVDLDFRNTPAPTCFAVRPGDSLFKRQSRISDIRENAWKEALPRETDAAVERELEILRQYADGDDVALPTEPDLAAGCERSFFIELDDGQIAGRYLSTGEGRRPVAIAPAIPFGHFTQRALAESLAEFADVYLFDPPGHANSDYPLQSDVDASARVCFEAMRRLGLEAADLFGAASGAFLAEAIHRQRGRGRLVLGDPAVIGNGGDAFGSSSDIDFNPDWYGGHLVRLWHHLRDVEIWRPWNDRTRHNLRDGLKTFDLDHHYGLFVETLAQAENYHAGWRSVFAYAANRNNAVSGPRISASIASNEERAVAIEAGFKAQVH